MAQEQSELLKAREAASYLRMSEVWIRLEARKGRLPCLHFGRSVRFRRSDLDAWLNTKRKQEG